MDWEEYLKIDEQYGTGSEQTKEAYLQLFLTELKSITESVVVDEWGDSIITCNERNDITTAELLSFITLFMEAECAIATIKGNNIKLSFY